MLLLLYRYRPHLAVSLVQSALAFPNREDCLGFVENTKVLLTPDKNKINTKDSASIVAAL